MESSVYKYITILSISNIIFHFFYVLWQITLFSADDVGEPQIAAGPPPDIDKATPDGMAFNSCIIS